MADVVFAVMPFSRAPDGRLMAGDAVEVASGDIAWRLAKAMAEEHDNVGAAAFSRSGLPPRPVSISECAMLTCFGAVDLQAIAG